MKTKITFLAILAFAFFSGFGQQVPNGSFESWSNGYYPDGWSTIERAEGVPLNLVSFPDSSTFTEGHVSAEILADSIAPIPAAGVVPGFLSLGTTDTAGGGINFIGIPFTYRPDTFVFDFKLASPNADTGFAQLFLTQNSVNTVLGVQIPLSNTNGWVHVAVPLAAYYQLNITPDTLLIQFFTTNPQAAVNHDTLHIDGIRFGYVVTATITTSGPTTFCAGDSVMLMADTGVNHSYQWYVGDTAITGATGASYWAKAAGSYTVTIDSVTFAYTSPAIVLHDTTCHGVGINSVSATELSVYPNPTTSLLNINSNEDLSGFNVELFDIVGRLVISQMLEGRSNTINVGKLAEGTYIYRVIDKENGIVAQSKLSVVR